MSKSMKWSRNFKTESILKSDLQLHLYTLAYEQYGIVSSVLCTPGADDVERHIRDARLTVARTDKSDLLFIDIDPDEYDGIINSLDRISNLPRVPTWYSRTSPRDEGGMRLLQARPYTHRIKLGCMDIADAPVTRFIDADLMTTFSSCGKSLVKLLRRQQAIKPSNYKKGFIFTLGMRGRKESAAKAWMNRSLFSIVGCSVNFGQKRRITNDDSCRASTHGANGVGVWEYESNMRIKGRVLGVHPFFYNDDGGPMFTCLLVYV